MVREVIKVANAKEVLKLLKEMAQNIKERKLFLSKQIVDGLFESKSGGNHISNMHMMYWEEISGRVSIIVREHFAGEEKGWYEITKLQIANTDIRSPQKAEVALFFEIS